MPAMSSCLLLGFEHLSTDVLFQFVPDTFNQIYIGLGTLKVLATS